MKPRLFLMPIAALLVALLVACGGDDKKDSGSNQSSSTSSSSQSSGGGSATLDLTKAGDKIAALKSFRFELAMKMSIPPPPAGSSKEDDIFGSTLLDALSDIKAEGAFVAPDKTDVTLKLAGIDLGFIQIGDKSWVRLGNTWQSADDELGFESSGTSPDDFFSDILPSGEVLSGAKTKTETVNGMKTTRYSFDKPAIEKLAKELGEDTGSFKDVDKANLDVWLNDDQVPVKISMAITGKDEKGQKVSIELQMSIKDLNKDIKIKAPI